jgi:beta-glucosidase
MSEPPYQNRSLPTDERVADLLDRMTLAEKAGQLVGIAPYLSGLDEDGILDAVTDHGVGTVSPMPLTFTPESGPGDVARFVERVQGAAVEDTRLGIPVLTPTDAVHGHAYVAGATVFPQNLALAAARDPSLVRECARVTAREMRATGTVQNYNPTADVAREPRWGRTFETYGESPHLCADLVAAEVGGYQTDPPEDERVLATAKHFPAYSEPTAGEDTAAVECSRTTMHRSFLPPFRAAVDAGVESVMPCYNAIDGEPVHGSARFLTDLLREDLAFDGLTVSDWEGVAQLHEDHHTADSLRTAVRQATAAGLDVASVGGVDHAEHLVALVESGAVDEAILDERAERVLRPKFELGLFEDPAVNPGAAAERVGTDEHRETALRAARRTMTLLENDGVLPLDPGLDSVFVTGPNADDLDAQCGGWTTPDLDDDAGTTVREGIEQVTGADTTVGYEQGASRRERTGLAAAREGAAAADAAVVILGESAYIHEFVPKNLAATAVADFPARSRFELPEAQRALLQAVHATGTPTALVLVTGRPLPIPWAAEHVPGILMAYYPGAAGGQAVAETLFGEHNPSGSLPISIPRSAAHLPTRFNHLPHAEPVGDGTHPPSYDPLYPFGHGRSYTDFEVGAVSVTPETVQPDGSVEVSVTVANVGERAGRHAVDVFVRDRVSSRITPVREWAGVATVALDPGERGTATVELSASALGVVHPDGERVVEPGGFEVLVGEETWTFAVEP